MATPDAETPLPDDIESAHRLIRELLASLHRQAHLNEKLQHQLELLLRRLYGRKSEKLDPDPLWLFAREALGAAGSQPTPEPATPETPKPPVEGHGREPLPARLPRRPVVHDVPPGERPCPDCGEIRRCIGEESREQLEYVPASLVVLQHARPKYACPSCRGNVVIAQRLPEPIEKGLPGPGLLAHVAVSKIVAVDDVRLDGRARRPARADRQGDAQSSPPVAGGADRRHARPRAGPRRPRDQDRPAVGPHRR